MRALPTVLEVSGAARPIINCLGINPLPQHSLLSPLSSVCTCVLTAPSFIANKCGGEKSQNSLLPLVAMVKWQRANFKGEDEGPSRD